MTPRLGLISCWIFRFHDCTYAFWKSGLIVAGATLAAVAEPVFKNVIALVLELVVTGRAKGGLPLNPLTALVTRWSVKMASPPPTTVVPFFKGSHAKPRRG